MPQPQCLTSWVSPDTPEYQQDDGTDLGSKNGQHSDIKVGTSSTMALPLNRRTFIASGAILATSAKSPATVAPSPSSAIPSHGQDAYRLRVAAAERLRNGLWPDSEPNGDESLYSDKRASFSKTLPHDDLGEVDPAAFAVFATTIGHGSADDFERLPRARQAVER